MRVKNIIHNNVLETELKHVDPSPSKNIEEEKKDKLKNIIKENIKFNISSIDTKLYYSQLIIIGLYMIICLISIIAKDFLSLINPILMLALVILLSSNPASIKNNRFLDVGTWNLISSFNMLIKSFNLSTISYEYQSITSFFTKLFIISLLLSGYPAFNTSFIVISLGLCFSYLLCFINKDMETIKESGKEIQSKELLYIVISSIIFGMAFKGSVANATVFTTVILLKYFQEAIKDFEITDIR